MNYYFVITYNPSRRCPHNQEMENILIRYNSGNLKEIIDYLNRNNCTREMNEEKTTIYTQDFETCLEIKRHFVSVLGATWNRESQEMLKYDPHYRLSKMHVSGIFTNPKYSTNNQGFSAMGTNLQLERSLETKAAKKVRFLDQVNIQDNIYQEEPILRQTTPHRKIETRRKSIYQEPRTINNTDLFNLPSNRHQKHMLGKFTCYSENEDNHTDLQLNQEFPVDHNMVEWPIKNNAGNLTGLQSEQNNFQAQSGIIQQEQYVGLLGTYSRGQGKEVLEISFEANPEIAKCLKTVAHMNPTITGCWEENIGTNRQALKIEFFDNELADLFILKLKTLPSGTSHFNFQDIREKSHKMDYPRDKIMEALDDIFPFEGSFEHQLNTPNRTEQPDLLEKQDNLENRDNIEQSQGLAENEDSTCLEETTENQADANQEKEPVRPSKRARKEKKEEDRTKDKSIKKGKSGKSARSRKSTNKSESVEEQQDQDILNLNYSPIPTEIQPETEAASRETQVTMDVIRKIKLYNKHKNQEAAELSRQEIRSKMIAIKLLLEKNL